LSNELDDSIISKFGGSVAKHTYVDGISDVDTLFVMKSSTKDFPSPKNLLSHMAQLISTRLGNGVTVSAGNLAVTVQYANDGMEIQILPAVQEEGGKVKIAALDGLRWSNIAPLRFQEALTKRNQECSGKLVPVIKLAKGILATLPDAQKLSGYHVESLAIAAFRNYSGEMTTHAMLVEFFAQAKQLVKAPIRDSTGQSVNVDDYLGAGNSDERLRRSYVLERIEKRMRNANAASSLDSWRDIFGLDEQ
jgi:hypothetical protein